MHVLLRECMCVCVVGIAAVSSPRSPPLWLSAATEPADVLLRPLIQPLQSSSSAPGGWGGASQQLWVHKRCHNTCRDQNQMKRNTHVPFIWQKEREREKKKPPHLSLEDNILAWTGRWEQPSFSSVRWTASTY